MAKMLEYEGGEKAKSESKMKATYMALGCRVKAYKKDLAKLLRDQPTAVGPAMS